VIVYAGAVMVLYVFVVAYVGGADTPLHRPGGSLKFLAPLFGLAVAVELCIAMLGTALKGVSSKGAPYVLGFGTPRHIGTLFLTTYLFPFEIASLLLLVAAIGAVVLARRRRGLEPDEEFEARVHLQRSAFSGTMAEAAGFREGAGTTTDAHEQTEPIGAQTSPPAGVGSPGETGEGGW
jgi:NADH-quinone oxidoreductase subunit J